MTATEDKDVWYRNVPRSFRIGSEKDYDPVVHFHGLWLHPLTHKKPAPIVFDEHFSKPAGCYSASNGVFTAPSDGTFLARVRVGAMDPESSEWTFPDFKVVNKTEDDVMTMKVNITTTEDSRLFFPPPKKLTLKKGESVRLVVESDVPDSAWGGRTPGITVWIYDVLALLN